MDKNYNVLEHILNYCIEIEEDCKLFNNSKEIFSSNRVYQKAITMSLLQIGELTTHLTDDFKKLTSNEVDWRNVKGLRNIIAHNYGSLKFEMIWQIKEYEIPQIKLFCQKYIELNKALNDEVVPEEESDLEL